MLSIRFKKDFTTGAVLVSLDAIVGFLSLELFALLGTKMSRQGIFFMVCF